MNKRLPLVGAVVAGATVGCHDDCCFVAGTRVATPRGPVPIERLRVGDLVYAWDLAAGAAVERRVLACLTSRVPRVLRVTFGELVLPGVTASHPFWDARSGRWRRAEDLDGAVALAWFPGAEAREVPHRGSVPVEGPAVVYNLTIEGEATYFAEGVLVHNKHGWSGEVSYAAIAPELGLTPELVDLGTVAVGDVVSITDFNLFHDSGGLIKVVEIELVGHPAFTLDPASAAPRQVKPYTDVDLAITYAPTDPGLHTTRLRVNSRSVRPWMEADLRAHALNPTHHDLDPSPLAVDFGLAMPGDTVHASIDVVNEGLLPMDLALTTTSSAVTLAGGTLSLTWDEPRAVVELAWEPTDTEPLVAELILQHRDLPPIVVPLAGNDARLTHEEDSDGDGRTPFEGDCDDTDPTVAPGLHDGLDDRDTDCDGDVDENELDVDRDGWTTAEGDCSDLSPWVWPGAEEFCDGLDNDCDGVVDPDAACSGAPEVPWSFCEPGGCSQPATPPSLAGALAAAALALTRRRSRRPPR